MRSHGFTLIEAMTSVALIGILSAIALPGFHSFKTKAVLTELTVQFSIFEKMAETHRDQFGSMPQNLSDFGMEVPKSMFFSYSAFLDTSKSSGGNAQSGKNTGKNNGNGQTKQVVCHQNHSITVANPAIYNAHLAHGDGIGQCANQGMEFVLQAQLINGLESDCAKGATLQSMINSTSAIRIETQGNCSHYMVGQSGF